MPLQAFSEQYFKYAFLMKNKHEEQSELTCEIGQFTLLMNLSPTPRKTLKRRPYKAKARRLPNESSKLLRYLHQEWSLSEALNSEKIGEI
jgi:hypothetical protein